MPKGHELVTNRQHCDGQYNIIIPRPGRSPCRQTAAAPLTAYHPHRRPESARRTRAMATSVSAREQQSAPGEAAIRHRRTRQPTRAPPTPVRAGRDQNTNWTISPCALLEFPVLVSWYGAVVSHANERPQTRLNDGFRRRRLAWSRQCYRRLTAFVT